MKVVRRTVDISGFGGGYEDVCQRMLARGVAYLAEVKPPVEMWDRGLKQSPNIIGIAIAESDGVKALEDAMMAGEDDVTGAMHQAVLNHLAYIHKHGEDGWLAELQKHGREPMEWEGEL